MADYQEILNTIYDELLQREDKGEVADYIPELAKVDSTKFGIYLNRIHEDNYGVGDAYTKFSIQSISKVFTLAMAFANQGNKLWNRVDVEPSGNPFNYLALLEQEEGIPRNPLINSGAIVVADCLLSTYDDPKAELLKFVRQLESSTV